MITLLRRIAVSVILLGVFVLSSFGCNSSSQNAAPAGSQSETPQSVLASLHTGDALSKEECVAFAVDLEKVVKESDANGANALFAWEWMIDISLAGLNQSKEDEKLLQPIREHGGIDQAGKDLFRDVTRITKAGGSYTFIRGFNRPEGKTVLFRLRFAEGGFNYHEITLVRRPDGIRGVDVYVFAAGEKMSESMRRLAIMLFGAKKHVSAHGLTGPEGELVASLPLFKKLMDAAKQRRGDEFMALYPQLPAQLRDEKIVLFMRLTFARDRSEKEFLEAFDAMRSKYPDDACADMIAIDGFAARQQYDEAHNAIQRLNAKVEADPYLDMLDGTLYLQEKKYERAIESANIAIEKNAGFWDAYSLRLDVTLEQRDFAGTAEVLTKCREEFELGPDFLKDPKYAEFLKSREYAKWLKVHK